MSPHHLIARLAADPGSAGLILDFDGTLAPIVDDPQESRLPGRLVPVLGDLAGILGVVAVVSGRPAAFLIERVTVEGVVLLGLYGLEEARDGAVHARPEAAAWREAVATARQRLQRDAAGLDGVRLEDKGLSVALHWRNAADHSLAERRVAELTRTVAADTGLAFEPGKLVAELRPPVDWDKGAAVRTVAAGLGLVCYLGDDLGDLPAFAAARAAGGAAVGVLHGDETPDALLAATDCLLDGSDAVAEWLTALRDALPNRGVVPRAP